MIDLSFYRRGDFARNPIVIKTPDEIWNKTQSIATLILVALASGLFVLLVWGGK